MAIANRHRLLSFFVGLFLLAGLFFSSQLANWLQVAGADSVCKKNYFVRPNPNEFIVQNVSGNTLTISKSLTMCPGLKGEVRRFQEVDSSGRCLTNCGLAEFVGDVVSINGNQVTINPGSFAGKPGYRSPQGGESLFIVWKDPSEGSGGATGGDGGVSTEDGGLSTAEYLRNFLVTLMGGTGGGGTGGGEVTPGAGGGATSLGDPTVIVKKDGQVVTGEVTLNHGEKLDVEINFKVLNSSAGIDLKKRFSSLFNFLKEGLAAGGALGVNGRRFTVGGSEQFILGTSYFTGLAVSPSTLDGDFSKLRSNGFGLVRVFMQWNPNGDWFEGSPSYSIITSNGGLDSNLVSNLKTLIAKARQNGLVVDLTFLKAYYPSMSVSTFAGALKSLAAQISDCDICIFDLDNETVSGLGASDFANIGDQIRSVAPKILVTASVIKEQSSRLVPYVTGGKLDVAAFHCCRANRDTGAGAAEETRSYVERISGSLNKPLYVSESGRRCKPNAERSCSDLSVGDYLGMATECKKNGCAAWVFHTAASFFMSGGTSLFDNLDSVEKSVVSGLSSALNAVEWGVPSSGNTSTPIQPGGTGGGGADGGGHSGSGGRRLFVNIVGFCKDTFPYLDLEKGINLNGKPWKRGRGCGEPAGLRGNRIYLDQLGSSDVKVTYSLVANTDLMLPGEKIMLIPGYFDKAGVTVKMEKAGENPDLFRSFCDNFEGGIGWCLSQNATSTDENATSTDENATSTDENATSTDENATSTSVTPTWREITGLWNIVSGSYVGKGRPKSGPHRRANVLAPVHLKSGTIQGIITTSKTQGFPYQNGILITSFGGHNYVRGVIVGTKTNKDRIAILERKGAGKFQEVAVTPAENLEAGTPYPVTVRVSPSGSGEKIEATLVANGKTYTVSKTFSDRIEGPVGLSTLFSSTAFDNIQICQESESCASFGSSTPPASSAFTDVGAAVLNYQAQTSSEENEDRLEDNEAAGFSSEVSAQRPAQRRGPSSIGGSATSTRQIKSLLQRFFDIGRIFRKNSIPIPSTSTNPTH